MSEEPMKVGGNSDFPYWKNSETPRTDAVVNEHGDCLLADFARTLERELSTIRARTEGMVMVPREPTPEMLEPFARLICAARGIDPDVQNSPDWPAWYPFCQEANECYKAMLSAS